MNPNERRWMWFTLDDPGDTCTLRHGGLTLQECVDDYKLTKKDDFKIIYFGENGRPKHTIDIREAERILKIEQL